VRGLVWQLSPKRSFLFGYAGNAATQAKIG
jgi:hypothetical protein